MRVLRLSHSGVVDAWRERERVARRAGHEVRSVTARVWDEGGRDVPLVPRPGEDVHGLRTWGRHPAIFVYDPRLLWRLLGERWDLIDIHEEPFALATAEVLLIRWLRRQRAPYLLYSAQNLHKRYPVPFRWLERWALRHASAASVCNRDAAAILEAKGLGGRAVVIGLGLHTDAFTPSSRAGPREDGNVRVGYVGRLAPHKGVHVLLEAIARDERLHLVVAGSGPSAEEVGALVAEHGTGERVELLGAIGHEDLPDLYRSLDVLAVPSLTTPGWLEQFGRVAVEAMACGVPVVASDSGALPDVVGGAGVLVPPGDAAALAEALVEVGTDQQRWAIMREQGLTRARAYDWEAIGGDYMRLYHEVARTGAAPRTGTTGTERGLEVVVVAYHSPDLLRSSLAPLAGRPDLPVTVVDNSSDTAVRAVCADLGVRYLDPGRNGGFAAGVNHALADRARPGADVLLLNPDAVIGPDGIAALHAALHADRHLASVAPAQVDGDGRPSRVAWPLPTPWGTALEALGLGRLRRDDYVIGSVLLLRAEALAQVGLLDEHFFLYGEETDWAARAAHLGWRHALVHEVTATHLGSATSSDPARREAHFHGSQERYHRKHFGALGWQVTRAATVLGSGVRGLVLRGERAADARDRFGRYLRGPVAVERALLARDGGDP